MNKIRKRITTVGIITILVILGFGFYKFFPEIWGDIFYPLEFRDEIVSASEEFDIERNLIAAVIFTESHFNPNAGSHAGAKGLMQLIPSTARGVAKNIGLNDYTDSKIFDPAINIRLGTAYLRSAIDSRGGNIDVALVNYNAGPKYAGLFQNTFNRTLIPRETDSYLRKVKSAWEAYDNIYGKDWSGPSKPFTKPENSTFVSQIKIGNLLNVLFGK